MDITGDCSTQITFSTFHFFLTPFFFNSTSAYIK